MAKNTDLKKKLKTINLLLIIPTNFKFRNGVVDSTPTPLQSTHLYFKYL